MRIDIAGIAGINGAYLEVSRDVLTETLGKGVAGIELGDKVHADLKIEYMEGTIAVKGRVTGRYTAQCGRCLVDTEDDFDITIDENFMHMSLDLNSTDDYLYKGGYIDLTIPLIDNILLSFPGVILCSDNCKGLCEVCGINLNETQCSCEKHDKSINIKMEKLKDYFNQ